MELKRGRLTRRAFLRAGSSGAAALALAACGGGSGNGGSTTITAATRTVGATGTRTATTTTTPTQTPLAPTLRYAGLVADDGTFDPHKTQAGPFYGQQSLVFSRLLTYASQAEGSIVNDLAASMPEQPDERTYIFRLQPGARWQAAFPLNGRAVTTEDVKFSIERQRDGDPSFVRKARWQNVESVETPSPEIVKVTVATPLATMLPTFAGVNAFIVAPETSPDGQDINLDLQVGSGPFRWVEWSPGSFASVSRNPGWFGGGGRPALSGIDIVQPRDSQDLEAQVRVKKLDAALLGRPQADALRASIPELVETTAGSASFFGMRFFTPQVPYNDPRFRRAVSIALDRRGMIDQFFAGSGEMSPWVSWPMTRWTLPQSELMSLAGYRAGPGGREQDVAEARALLAAFASDSTVPADNALFVIDEAEAAVGMGSLMRDQLKAVLDLNVTVYPITISELVTRLFQGEAPWAAGPDTGSIDLDDWLFPYFHSSGVKNSMAVRDAELDALIESQRIAFDADARRAIGHDVQRRLMAMDAAVNFVSERVVALSWPYVNGFPIDTSDGYQQRFADASIDVTHVSFRGRP
ncbi:MAG: ABC transporter substrate-binding protein [Dehalococcoidia bacterium]|nr:ABC transporter substrate-binding protein [Dehalococcoidia bacterium]MCB9485864.1 ABC transporter substrate-binding protein [Thermoflexaceae bacterium]